MPFSVLDKSDHRFRDLQKPLDSVGSELYRQGIGATKKSAQVIDPKHEDLFLEKGLLGLSSPRVLQVTLLFYLGLNFVLRYFISGICCCSCVKIVYSLRSITTDSC